MAALRGGHNKATQSKQSGVCVGRLSVSFRCGARYVNISVSATRRPTIYWCRVIAYRYTNTPCSRSFSIAAFRLSYVISRPP